MTTRHGKFPCILPRLSPVIGYSVPTDASKASTALGRCSGRAPGGISARTDIRTSLTSRAATTSSMSSLSVQGQSAELRGFGDPSFRNQHRVGRLTAGSPQVTADRGGIDRSFVDNQLHSKFTCTLPRLSQVIGSFMPTDASKASTARGRCSGRAPGGISARTSIRTSSTTRAATTSSMSVCRVCRSQGQSAELRRFGDP